MKKDASEFLPLLIRDTKRIESRNAAFPDLKEVTLKSVSVPLGAVRANLGEVVRTLQTMLSECTASETEYLVDSITVNLSIDASGKVFLLGEVGAAVHSGVSITVKRKSG